MALYKKNRDDRHSSFCIGNGIVCAYYHYGNIRQMFGPVYSTPSVFSVCIQQMLAFESERRSGTAVWDTAVYKEGIRIGTITDFAHRTQAVLYRVMEWETDVELCFSTEFSYSSIDALLPSGQGVMACVPEGSTVFSLCKTDKEFYCALLIGGEAAMHGNTIHCRKGRSVICFVAGDAGKDKVSSFSACVSLCHSAMEVSVEAELSDTIAGWQEFFANVHDFSAELQKTKLSPERQKEVLKMVEDVAVCLKTQTSRQGGILAGQHYHLAYGRDSYGDVRGYLALGLYEEAKTCISFFCEVFRKRGFVPNASGMGVDCAHCHENDASEQTGYCLLYFTDYYKATKDSTFLEDNKEFIVWLMEVQKQQLHRDMMPFNGDETYIAGGLVPRSAIDNGSMEATAICIQSIETMLAVDEELKLFTDAFHAEYQQTVAQVKAAFCDNFIENETIYINNPRRAEDAPLPRTRHGVCHGCGGIRHLCRTEERGYLCTDCFGKKPSGISRTKFMLDCAVLMPIFTGARLPKHMIEKQLAKVLDEKRQTNFDRSTAKKLVGYEYGLILYVAAQMGISEGLEDVVCYLLEQRDCFGVWSEYYQDGKAFESSCPYRPWESAINMIGMITYLLG